jgi:hypothetical protein
MDADERRPDDDTGQDQIDEDRKRADAIRDRDPAAPAQGAVPTDDDRDLPEPNEPA